MVSLPAVIKPDRNQRKQSQALLNDFKFISADLNGIAIAADNLNIEYSQKDHLAKQAPPLFTSEKVKDQNH